MTQPVDHGLNRRSPAADTDACPNAAEPDAGRRALIVPGTTIGPTTGPAADAASDHERVAGIVADAIGPQNFEHWLRHRSRLTVTDDSLQIFVPNPFISNWLLKRFRTQFTRAAAELLGPSAAFQLSVDESLQINAAGHDSTTATNNRTSAERTSTAPVPTSRTLIHRTGPESRHVDNCRRPDVARAGMVSVQGAHGDANSGSAVRTPGRRRFQTFSTLVSGECNDLALLAARQVAEFPGQRFNPLYLHGPTGVGKTHLLEAVYSDMRVRFPQLNVLFLTSEAFTNYFLQALNSRTVPSFRQRFRNVDVLLIDSIEFLDNKRATQEEFLFTIVQVIEHGGQLVVTGDRHPRLLNKHREELTTRFLSGLVCRMDPPDEETRRRIVAGYALPMRDSFTQETLDFVARRCRNNVREIQGALNCLHG
ncbi:MAG: ATP-binding protein, partial [Planctomycetaceae bacterium]|nr:ATP-binding protein [Planctomycetaceae bacterium]